MSVVTTLSGVETMADSNKPFDVHTLDGVKIRKQVRSLEGLPKGIYIVNNKKWWSDRNSVDRHGFG